jgi:hypothetical protein
VDGSKYWVSGIDECGWISFTDDGSQLAEIYESDISNVFRAVLDTFDPDKITIENVDIISDLNMNWY